MSQDKHEPSRLELYQAGKLEERRASRRPSVPEKIEVQPEEVTGGFKLRPEIIAISLMVLALVILALIGM